MDPNFICKVLIFLRKETPLSYLPTTILKIGMNEKNLLVEDIRNQLYEKIHQSGEKLKSKFEYALFFSDGKRLDEIAFLSSLMDQLKLNLKLFFAHIHLEAELKNKIANQYVIDEEENQKIQKQKQFEPILQNLKQDLRNKFTFQKLIGDLNFIILNPSLNITRYKLEELHKLKLKNYIQVANEIQQTHEFESQSDRHFLITFILNMVLNFMDKCFIHNEYYISPQFEIKEKQRKEIERKADCVIYEKLMNNVICLSEIKKSDDDIADCIRKNADQLRAYCICNNKTICRGIATTAEIWFFTEYSRKNLLEIFSVSKPFNLLEKKEPMKIYLIKENCLDFFEFLFGFFKESLGLIKND